MLQCYCYTVAAVSDRHLICAQTQINRRGEPRSPIRVRCTRFARNACKFEHTVWVIPKYLHKHKHSSRRADGIRTYRIAALIKFILIYNLYRYLSAFDVCRYNFTNVKNCLIWIILQTKYNFNFNYIQLFLGKNKRRFLTARHTILYLN